MAADETGGREVPERFRFSAVLWRAEAQDAWFFVTLPPDVAEGVRRRPRPPRGFGSVRVEVTVGSSTWRTSVFPDTARGSYVLPVKKAVRVAEDLEEDEPVEVALEVLE
jgi:hypothetical protein